MSAGEIPPGGEGTINVTFKPFNRDGVQKKSVVVETNDPATPRLRLEVSARVEIKLAVNPATIAFPAFSARNGSTQPLYARLTGSDSASVKIVSVESTDDLIRVDLDEQGFDGDPSRQIRISVLPGMNQGRFRERVVFTTDSASTGTLSLFVTGEVIGDITVTPKHLPFGVIGPGRAVRRTIRLQSTNEAFTFNVTGVSSTVDEMVTELITVIPGREYQVHVSLPDGYPHQVLRGEVVITTDDRDQGAITVRFFGRAAGPQPVRPGATGPN